ncbi:MAG TPA: hypothetical protein DGC76_02685, partial [Candidatus Accumulibacter sp.]|nr:hypothetical protein [Accumulibacter sp.]
AWVGGAGGDCAAAASGSAALGGKPAGAAGAAAAARERSVAAAQVSDLLRQIRVREAQGLPTEQLRRQLDQAVEALKP